MNDIIFSIQLSLMVACVSTVFVASFGSALGFVLARFKFPGRNLLDALLTLPLILPPTVVGFYLLGFFGKNGLVGKQIFELTGWSPVFTWQACVISAIVISLPLMVKTSKAAFESLDTKLEDVSMTLGKSRLQTIFLVTLPLAARGLIAGVALSFARALGEFGATLMIAGNIPGRTQTLPLLIFQATQTGETDLVLSLVLVLSLFSLLVALLSNEWKVHW
ncbi:MAG: molybdate ABC transporter permease subunit [Candidatus Obscuribacterales bacterium]|jgi:molybdate transport system permease protein|nr:molybdate ABC transporter permease subunit [Candidatus Obscuribacterales bacterium]